LLITKIYETFLALIGSHVNLSVYTTAGYVVNVLVHTNSCRETTGSN